MLLDENLFREYIERGVPAGIKRGPYKKRVKEEPKEKMDYDSFIKSIEKFSPGFRTRPLFRSGKSYAKVDRIVGGRGPRGAIEYKIIKDESVLDNLKDFLSEKGISFKYEEHPAYGENWLLVELPENLTESLIEEEPYNIGTWEAIDAIDAGDRLSYMMSEFEKAGLKTYIRPNGYLTVEGDVDTIKRVARELGFLDETIENNWGTINESIQQSTSASGDEMTFDIDDEGNLIIKEGDKVILKNKVENPEFARKQIKELCIKTIKEDLDLAPTETGLVEHEAQVEEPAPEGQSEGLQTILNNLINAENDTVNDYNSAIVTFETEGRGDLTDVFREILKDEQNHIGNLQKLLNEFNPETIPNIEAGQEEAQSTLQGGV